ncbi:MAG: nucleoside phosphorylase [Chloroflexota bacterium]
MEKIPLTEFDPDVSAIIEPTRVSGKVISSKYCVMPIYGSLIMKLEKEGKLKKIYQTSTELISIMPAGIYEIEYGGKTCIVANPGVGAPFAAAMLEELIAMGCRKFVACGSAGVLKQELKRGAIVIPSSALRDEGTSYHYSPPSRYIEMDSKVVEKLERVLQKYHVNYEVGRTWTTDAFYRETRGKISQRKMEKCLTVEMECSALIAVAEFRNVKFGQYLAVGDDVSGEQWDPRYVGDKMTFQEKIFWLSIEACLSL